MLNLRRLYPDDSSRSTSNETSKKVSIFFKIGLTDIQWSWISRKCQQLCEWYQPGIFLARLGTLFVPPTNQQFQPVRKNSPDFKPFFFYTWPIQDFSNFSVGYTPLPICMQILILIPKDFDMWVSQWVIILWEMHWLHWLTHSCIKIIRYFQQSLRLQNLTTYRFMCTTVEKI